MLYLLLQTLHALIGGDEIKGVPCFIGCCEQTDEAELLAQRGIRQVLFEN